MATWRELITNELYYRKESWEDVVSCALSESDLDTEFDVEFGNDGPHRGAIPFIIWTLKNVYFSFAYLHSVGVESVSRNPYPNPDHAPRFHIGA